MELEPLSPVFRTGCCALNLNKKMIFFHFLMIDVASLFFLRISERVSHLSFRSQLAFHRADLGHGFLCRPGVNNSHARIAEAGRSDRISRNEISAFIVSLTLRTGLQHWSSAGVFWGIIHYSGPWLSFTVAFSVHKSTNVLWKPTGVALTLFLFLLNLNWLTYKYIVLTRGKRLERFWHQIDIVNTYVPNCR